MKKPYKMSLAMEMAVVSIFSLIAAIIFYIVLSMVTDAALDKMFDTEQYYKKCDEETISSLEKYIEEYDVKSDDWYMLSRWVSEINVVTLTVYKDDVLVYDSDTMLSSYEDTESTETDDDSSTSVNSAVMIESDYAMHASYKVNFADGEADVLIYGFYSTNYYRIAYILEFCFPCLLFILIILVAVRKKMKYLVQLSEEVHRMKNGDLEHPITVLGSDEIAMLAESVDSLRLSFIQKLAHIMQLQDESKALVTEMSHDLRTPMTSLMIYLGMLREHRYESDEERDSYIEKSYEKVAQLKHMSDNMFSYFIMDKNADISLETVSMYDAFYDQLSSMKGYLTLEGYQIKINMNIVDVNIKVNSEFMIRIFDNIVSNILKYADRTNAVIVSLFNENDKVILHVSNRINELADHSTSTGFGVKNIKKMMQQMSSECIIHQKDDRYDTFLLFRTTTEAADDQSNYRFKYTTLKNRQSHDRQKST